MRVDHPSNGVNFARRSTSMPPLTSMPPPANGLITTADAVVCINMIHIAPWVATVGLVRGAARVLPPRGLLYPYGPFRRDGRHTAPSNESFDQDLRRQDPSWGVRDLEAITELADAVDFAIPLIEAMPANNLSVVFRRRA